MRKDLEEEEELPSAAERAPVLTGEPDRMAETGLEKPLGLLCVTRKT